MTALFWNNVQNPITAIPFSVLFGFLFDLLAGDPSWLTHPVVIMGKTVTFLENRLRGRFGDTPAGQRMAGSLLAALMAASSLALPAILLFALQRIYPLLRFLLETVWCWQCLAVRDMVRETGAVYKVLKTDDLPKARKQVSRIVGRDTASLDHPGVARAAVETTAENLSDGVIAPLFYMVIGGAPLALFYKCVNTMDSMIGYKNKKYLHFGNAAAKLDDRANFLPSRLAALFLILSARICQGSEAAKRAFKIWKRDRLKHPSPNSAQTESVMAGALGVRLLGPTSYFGKLHKKEWIGDSLREVETKDIAKACRMFLVGSFVALIFLLGARGLCAAAVRYMPILFRRIIG